MREKFYSMIGFFLVGVVSAWFGYICLASYDFEQAMWLTVTKGVLIFLSAGITMVMWSCAYVFFRKWQFDVQLKEMNEDFKRCEVGVIRIRCYSPELADAFWSQHKGQIRDRQKWDPNKGLFIGRKMF